MKFKVSPEGRPDVYLVAVADLAAWLDDYFKAHEYMHNFIANDDSPMIVGADWTRQDFDPHLEGDVTWAVALADGTFAGHRLICVDMNGKRGTRYVFDVGPITKDDLEVIGETEAVLAPSFSPDIDYDEYGEVINGPRTAAAIAMHLLHGGSALVGWNDGEATHFDILFTLEPFKSGIVQGGLHSGRNLFVSIMRIGAFGFDVSRPDTHPSYYAEKLHLDGPNVTTEKLAELINGIKELIK